MYYITVRQDNLVCMVFIDSLINGRYTQVLYDSQYKILYNGCYKEVLLYTTSVNIYI